MNAEPLDSRVQVPVLAVPRDRSLEQVTSVSQLSENSAVAGHIEAFYTYRVNDNITVTPDFYVITKPEHNDNNDPIWVGALRTTFAF
ncbi:carbohydrate porin [Nostoc flagelliforme]|uniref:carbohydrate porin n=1 Tax=Nostoc flagelliforme TaxID=1306274 RepID=UPI0030CC6814